MIIDCHCHVELHKIRLLGLSPSEESLVLGKNLWRLISGAIAPRETGEMSGYADVGLTPGVRSI